VSEKLLKPIVQTAAMTKGIEAELFEYMSETLFKPLLDILAAFNIKLNSKEGNAVIDALKSRKLYYMEGLFTGTFNAAISRELRAAGAVKIEKAHAFRLPVVKVPMSWRIAAAESQTAANNLQKQVLQTLDTIQNNIGQAKAGLKIEGEFGEVLTNLEEQFKNSVSGVGVSGEMTPGMQKQIREEYILNLERSIKKFSEKRIPELRRKIQEHAMEGMRPDKLAKIIIADYGVSKSKAAFLAQQETSLMISKYRETRFKEVGSRRYVWKTSKDSHVRKDHTDLNNRIFSWDSPPIKNKATGERNNPGEDYGCRCIAVPILDIQED
jgi:SPP1 gp7 family putative phage head morphogenesis protein